MATIRNERFVGQQIDIDGNRYESCSFTDCQLIYGGGSLPAFVNCTFRQSAVRLAGSARKTMQYLQYVNGIGLRVGADRILGDIQRGEVQTSRRGLRPPPEYTGTNFVSVAIYSFVTVAVAILLGAALWYGYIYHPTNVVLEREPAQPLFVTPILDLMPVLPADLADIYDGLRADQLEQINGYEWVDAQQGVARIPIQQAISHLAENGIPAMSPAAPDPVDAASEQIDDTDSTATTGSAEDDSSPAESAGTDTGEGQSPDSTTGGEPNAGGN